MFKKTKASTIEEYLESVPDNRQEIVRFFHDFIKKTVPKLKPHFANNMIGYGSFPYLNYKKEEISWPTIALDNQKNYVSIYACSVDVGQYVAEKYQDKLGKVSVGKSCIRFKKIEDVDLKVLATVLKEAAGNPGLR